MAHVGRIRTWPSQQSVVVCARPEPPMAGGPNQAIETDAQRRRGSS
jgi:hypothetical protein